MLSAEFLGSLPDEMLLAQNKLLQKVWEDRNAGKFTVGFTKKNILSLNHALISEIRNRSLVCDELHPLNVMSLSKHLKSEKQCTCDGKPCPCKPKEMGHGSDVQLFLTDETNEHTHVWSPGMPETSTPLENDSDHVHIVNEELGIAEESNGHIHILTDVPFKEQSANEEKELSTDSSSFGAGVNEAQPSTSGNHIEKRRLKFERATGRKCPDGMVPIGTHGCYRPLN